MNASDVFPELKPENKAKAEQLLKELKENHSAAVLAALLPMMKDDRYRNRK